MSDQYSDSAGMSDQYNYVAVLSLNLYLIPTLFLYN